MPDRTYRREYLVLGPAGVYHADALDGRVIVATPVTLAWHEDAEGEFYVEITPAGEQVALPADDARVMPYEGRGTAAEVLSRQTA